MPGKSPLERLYAGRRITRREYDAGLLVQSLHRGLWQYRGHQRAAAAIEQMRSAIDAVEIDLWPLLQAVCVQQRMPRTSAGLTRLRQALVMVTGEKSPIRC